jgi:hypothetical protein
MADEWKWVMGILVVVIIAMVFTGHLKGNVNFQSIVGVDCPTFKTNAVNNVYNLYTVWVAADCNGDGLYESYKWQGTESQTNTLSSGLLETIPAGRKYNCYNGASGWEVHIWTNIVSLPYKYLTYSQQSGADLTCTASCTPSCTGKVCGDNGCGGSCGTCNSGYTCNLNQCVVNGNGTSYCDFPGNGDNKINRDELGSVGMRWVTGN